MARPQAQSARKDSASDKKAGAKPARSAAKRALRVGSSLLRPKLKVGASTDPAERDADEMADAVLRRADEARKKGKKEELDAEPPEVLKAPARVPHDAQEAPPHVQARVSALKGSGRPLPEATQSSLGPHMGTDLAAVRVHTGSQAAALTEAVGARALTVGNDVAFNQGEFQPHTPDGQRLIAHELSHVAQQQGSAQPHVQRETKKRKGPAGSDVVGDDGILDEPNELVRFHSLRVPGFKLSAHRQIPYGAWKRPFRRNKAYDRKAPSEETDHEEDSLRKGQSELWKEDIQPRLAPILQDVVRTALGQEHLDESKPIPLVYPGDRGPTDQALSAHVERLVRPDWGRRDGKAVPGKKYEVDHIVELQVSNWPTTTTANTIENFELLEKTLNGSSGGKVRGQVWGSARRYLVAQGEKASRDDVKDFIKKHDLLFDEVIPADPVPANTEDFWTHGQIARGEHLADLELARKEVRVLGILKPHDAAWERPLSRSKAHGKAPFAPLEVLHEEYRTSRADVADPELGTMRVGIGKDNKAFKPSEAVDLKVTRLPGAQFAGAVDGAAVIDVAKRLEVKSASPVRFTDLKWDPDQGLLGHGKVVANHDGAGAGLYKKGPPVGPDLALIGGTASTTGALPADQLDLPGPIEVKSSSILFGGNEDSGLTVKGEVAVEAHQFGTGKFSASVGSNGFAVSGTVHVKTPWFAPEELNVAYDRDDGLAGSVDVKIPTGKIPGLKQGKAKLSVAGDSFGLSGEVQFAALGLEQTLAVGWSQEKGITIGGSIPIPSGKIPGVSGGSIDGQITQTPDGAMSFAAHGRADVAVPGLGGGIDVWWNDGLFRAEGTVATQHENLRGNVTVGVSNEEVGKDGQPTGKPGKSLHAYGKGHVDAVFGKNLRGAVDVALTPKAELVLDGELALQNEIKLFDLPKFPRRSLLGPWKLEFPVLAVPAATITAFVRGGLYGEAGGGPAVLRNVKAGAHFEPSHPEKTLIAGGAEFYLPMHAGLTLEVEAGLGAHVVAASVNGSLGVDATLGLDAEARAPVALAWTPQAGLAVSAFLNATVQPKFAFDVFGKVGVDVWPFGEVWGKRWDLKHFEWGPGIQFGVQWPIGYKEAEGFQASFDDIKFIQPDIDIIQMLKGLVSEIT
jgi:hypothetical protein